MELNQFYNPGSRVWIYQSNRDFTMDEMARISEAGQSFISGWNAHGSKVKGCFEVVRNRFILILADEQASALTSGCSVDASVAVIRNLDVVLKADLFDRLTVCYEDGNLIKQCSYHDLPKLFTQGILTKDTIVYNNLVSTYREWQENWRVPFGKSWFYEKLIGSVQHA